MQGKRTDRINALIQNEIGRIISTRLKDERLGFVTVNTVQTSPDLKNCTIRVSVIGSEKEAAGTIAALQHSEGFIKKELSAQLQLRFMPKLYFKIDNSIEAGMRLDQIFDQLHAEEKEKEQGEDE